MKRSPLTRRFDEDYAITYLLAPPRQSGKPIGREDKDHIAINVVTGDFWWFNEGIGEWCEIDDIDAVKAEAMGIKRPGMQYRLTFGELVQFRELLDNIRIDLEEGTTSL